MENKHSLYRSMVNEVVWFAVTELLKILMIQLYSALIVKTKLLFSLVKPVNFLPVDIFFLLFYKFALLLLVLASNF